MSIWPFITNFGDAAVMLPCALLIGLWLALGSGLRALLLWFGLFALACLLTAATKIAFFGWGIGSRELDFTGFSGHSMQAASVLPVLAWLLFGQGRLRPLAPWLGVGAAVLVAYSRVRLGYHSPSEAITGTLLGLAVAALCLRLLPDQVRLPRRQTLALTTSLLLPLVLLHGLRAPTPDLMRTLGTLAAGSDRPYTRADLHARTSAPVN